MSAQKIESKRQRSRPVTKRKKTDALKKNYWAMAIVILIVISLALSSVYVVFTINSDDDTSSSTGANPIAVIDTSKGEIRVELYQDKTPNTVDNFVKLANDDFYDGLVFHRVIDGFMIQGGGFYPDGTQKTSPYGSIDLEIDPDIKHVDGAIAMARTSDPNSATSQFFINDGAQPSLEPGGVDENGYAAFGVVVEGMDVVRDISSVSTTSKNGMQDWPVQDVIINSITIEQGEE